MAEPEKLRIGDFVLDPSRNLLCGLEGELALEPKVVDVLLTLAAEPGVVLSRDALIDAVWKAEFGADERLTRAIYQLRKAFSDDRGSHRYIETVSKRGYRLVAAVEVLAETPAQSQPPAISAPAPPNVEAPSPEPQTDAPTRTAVDVSSAASIERSPPPSPVRWWQNRSAHAAGAAAVLAVVAIAAWLWASSGSAETRYAEDVIELRPVVVIGDEPGLPDFARGAYAAVKRVFASHQLRAVEHDDTPPQEPARRESEFILSGTLEKAADAYTVTLYFDNRANGQTLWSERLIRPVAQKTELQEAIGAIAANLISCGLRQRAKALRRPSLQAFMIYLEICDPKLWSDNGETALATAERLVAIAPDDPHGHGYAAFVNSVLAKDRPDFTRAQIDFYAGAARKAAARALELDPKNEDALAATALLGSGAQHWLGLDALAERIAWMKSWSLRRSGRITEAFHVQGTVVASTPLSLNDRVARASLAITAGYHEAADRELANVLQLQPDHRGGHWRERNRAREGLYRRPRRARGALAIFHYSSSFGERDPAHPRGWPDHAQREVRALHAGLLGRALRRFLFGGQF